MTLLPKSPIGLLLFVHSRVHEKNLGKNHFEVYMGSDYQKIFVLEKRVETVVLQQMVENGGFSLFDFVKKDVSLLFAVDNIDFFEDTPTEQNTFHGTVTVINQRTDDGEPVNQKLIIPEKYL